MKQSKIIFGKSIDEWVKLTGLPAWKIRKRYNKGLPQKEVFSKENLNSKYHNFEYQTKFEVMYKGKKYSFTTAVKLATNGKRNTNYANLKDRAKYKGLTVQETFDFYIAEYNRRNGVENGNS